ncbi:3-methylmercaptopropionyl-CoA dehydrogenase [Sinobacterium norvegicum]|uniref:3-methylmercaptopropionyl-CoA dehydrogenase n=1 Tax=Sinobacterium norvegicum TaxID=1641715 RepID=A0ABN8EEA1_9GAMM|nr:acyl-CoA dehydrogenase C-terminal domain-containing protein [Sinobacterium norvegicum]CAH0990556.1 3-methylmercaptopropionyl-CoA dehydrogenase [Sinobacterium norvegicum]
MANYKAPLRDIQFVFDEILDSETHYKNLPGSEDFSLELRDAIFNEAAKFTEHTLSPLRRVGDEEGCTWSEQGVTTPTGFAAAYHQYVEGGWPGLSMPEQFGGQNLPLSIDLAVSEMVCQANHAWSMYPGLSAGCRATLVAHGTDEQRETYLHKLVSGEWTGTMCLTEPQCGSDLSFLRTKAEDNADGSYDITGTKIFISSGDHDMAENIIHIVLARLPDAPAGTKGISLFIVPKVMPNDDGSLGERNTVSCGSIEHKMGIHGNATCVLNFDGAKGYLIGEANRGLNCMFTFMNTARIGTSLQGMCHSEVALQGAMNYALDREAGRSLTGVKSPDRPADQLIVHADVRRMLQTIRAFAEGNRAFSYFLAQMSDREWRSEGDDQKTALDLLSLLTPIAKGFMTETGLEASNLGVQVYGGHGYIREWGMEQNLRDARISTLYEGTTGIQGLDLLARKVMSDGGANFGQFVAMVTEESQQMAPEFAEPLQQALAEWAELTALIGAKTQQNLDELGAASVDYLMYSGYVVLAWFWGKMGTVAKNQPNQDAFYRVKYGTAQFYFQKLLPRTAAHKATIETGAEVLMAVSDDDFRELNR